MSTNNPTFRQGDWVRIQFGSIFDDYEGEVRSPGLVRSKSLLRQHAEPVLASARIGSGFCSLLFFGHLAQHVPKLVVRIETNGFLQILDGFIILVLASIGDSPIGICREDR